MLLSGADPSTRHPYRGLAVDGAPNGDFVVGDLGVEFAHAGLETGDDFGVFGGKVGSFGEVFGEVEEEGLGLLWFSKLEEFPLLTADADEGSTARVVEELAAG